VDTLVLYFVHSYSVIPSNIPFVRTVWPSTC